MAPDLPCVGQSCAGKGAVEYRVREKAVCSALGLLLGEEHERREQVLTFFGAKAT